MTPYCDVTEHSIKRHGEEARKFFTNLKEEYNM